MGSLLARQSRRTRRLTGCALAAMAAALAQPALAQTTADQTAADQTAADQAAIPVLQGVPARAPNPAADTASSRVSQAGVQDGFASSNDSLSDGTVLAAGQVPVPPPPADIALPQIDPIIPDAEFNAVVPDLPPPDEDPELDRPLESIAEFERRLAAQPAPGEAAAAVANGAPPAAVAPPALAQEGTRAAARDEAIGTAAITDPELAAPLPPIDQFEVEPPVEFAEADTDRQAAEVPYTVRLAGLEEVDEQSAADLEAMFYSLASLGRGDGEAANGAQLAARLTEDSRLMEQILESEGWYSGTVTTRIEQNPEAENPRRQAIITVQPGLRYELAEINIDAGPTEPAGLIRDNLALQVGEPIVAARVQGAEAQVALALPENGYPFATVGARDILLDSVTGDGIYTLPVTVGPRARYGAITTTGEQAFGADHIAVLSRFERGELYDSRMVDDLRQALVATGLFSTITVVPQQTGEAVGDGTEYVNLLVDQQAGPPRTISGSAGYGTGEGFTITGGWQNRNLFPPEGALIATGILGTKQQGASVQFRRSNAGTRDRTFLATAEAYHQNYDAFEAYTGRLSALISRESTPIWQKPFTYAYGVQLIGTVEEDFNFNTNMLNDRTFFIAGLTGQAGFDTSDSLLNPTQGFRLTTLIEPEGSLSGGFAPYVRARIDGSAYVPVGESLVVAGRLRFGTIQGVDRGTLAPSRRFYAGGGGSVRGYGYQQIGPRVTFADPDYDPEEDDEDDQFITRPIGGRSLVEGAAEVRYRFGDYGVVAFVDAGQVYEETFPTFSSFQYGAGIGGRFYTNFGPFRLDLATPLNPRPGDSRINIYVSIGQAF